MQRSYILWFWLPLCFLMLNNAHADSMRQNVYFDHYQALKEFYLQQYHLNQLPTSAEELIHHPKHLSLESLPIDFQQQAWQERKYLFIMILLPMIAIEQEKILKRRHHILSLQDKNGNLRQDLSFKEQKFYQIELQRYKVKNFHALLLACDYIPTSLTLAQAAIESGWGKSRYSFVANALFGQWVQKNNNGLGIASTQHSDKDWGIRQFAYLQDSITAFMHNLNTHPAYKALRSKRALMRQLGLMHDRYVSEQALIEILNTLEIYASADHYVTKILKLIKSNDLQIFDDKS
jgi:Bax protein